MVVDQNQTRRRHHPSSRAGRPRAEERGFGTEIRSGGSSDTEDDGSFNGNVSFNGNGDDSQRNRERRRKQRRRKGDDPPFLVLFFQVGVVLLMVCLSAFHLYRYAYPPGTPGGGGGDDDYLVDPGEMEYEVLPQGNEGGDTYRRDQEVKLRELLRPAETEAVDGDEHDPPQNEARRAPTAAPTQPLNRTMPPLPVFDLSASSDWDAFRIAGALAEEKERRTTGPFWKAARDLRSNFTELYGGENAARMLLDRGLFVPSGGAGSNSNSNSGSGNSPPSHVVATACRLHRARAEERPVRMAFGGYSVTTGRGNKHGDSYPFRLKELLEPVLAAAGFAGPSGPIVVRNAAVGGIPSFPYGWCMAEFFGGRGSREGDPAAAVPDVVSWDFGMNEAGGEPEGLEAYVRQLISTYSSPPREGPPVLPKLIVKDTFASDRRRDVLAGYAAFLTDPVVLHTDHAVEPVFAATGGAPSGENEKDDWKKPPGFRKWRKWGAPRGAPGQASHHPAVQEHRLNAWILAMHFVAALEYMVAMDENENENENEPSWTAACSSALGGSGAGSGPSVPLPPPASLANNTGSDRDGIFFGHPLAQGTEAAPAGTWAMNPVRCRTTFEPKLSGDLTEIVVSGTIGEDLDPVLPKSQFYYNQGWTYDLSEAEKNAKRRLGTYPDGLGFRDSKEAYYGIFESPPLALLLPYESGNGPPAGKTPDLPSAGDPASDWYKSIVLCQVNDKNTFDSAFADESSCNFATDVDVRVGGKNVTKNATNMLNMVGSTYLGKPICKHVEIPPGARLSSHNALVREGLSLRGSDAVVSGSDMDSKLLAVDQVGLVVEVYVSNPRVVHVHQACSLSHVVWEEQTIIHTRPKSKENR